MEQKIVEYNMKYENIAENNIRIIKNNYKFIIEVNFPSKPIQSSSILTIPVQFPSIPIQLSQNLFITVNTYSITKKRKLMLLF